MAGLEGQMREVLEQWSLRPMVEALIALRGVDVVTAMTVLAELGDLTRFDSPRELMSFLGLVPSEHSSGPRRCQGAITKTGNGHVRRVLVETAWSYRFPARKTRHLRCKASAAPPAVQAIVWAAQKRLCTRYRHLYNAGKAKCVVTTGGGPRVGGVPLGDCLRGDGPGPCNAGAELRDGPEFSTPCQRSAVYSKHAVPWTRCGELLLRCLPGRNATMRFRSKAGPKRNVLDSGRGRPVRRILVHAMRGLAQPDRPTSLDRGSSATK